ncbi:restriction endonuclease subunit S [Catellatospora coxensis]|uniref:restriction endonuclease subunit S n=1 Tax=Catellatospora coxensis TaxID=310354 RepID=UPI001EF32850|nr:restriction endonuclease subunit S [Catellatospora coxensis]
MELPDGWIRIRLGDLLLGIEAGKSYTCEPRRAEADEWGIIKVSAMTWGEFDEQENKAVPAHRQPDPRYEIRPGDVLVSRANTEAYVGAPVLVGQCRPRLLLSDKSLRLIPCSEIDRRWLVYMLSSPWVRAQISAKATGAQDSMRNISQDALASIEILLAPLAEQRRIVEALDGQLSRLMAADAYVNSARKWMLSYDNARRRKLLEPWLSSTRKLHELLASPLVNGRSVPTDDEGFPVLRLTAIRDRVLDLTARKGGAWHEEDARPFLINRGDFMVSRGNGSLRLVARGALVVDDPDPVAFPDTMIRVRPDSRAINPEYLAFVWDSPTVREQIESKARTTAGIYKVNQRILELLDIPVPPLDVQAEIVKIASEHFAAANRLAAATRRATRRSQHLRRALLAKTLAGKVLPQDPSDEPASILLKRLETERMSRPKATRPRRTSATTSTTPPRQTRQVSAGIQEELPL